MSNLFKLDDKARIKWLKVALGISAATNIITAFATASVLRAYTNGRASSIKDLLATVFSVMEPTTEQLEEIKALIQFNNEFEGWVKDLAK